MEYNKLIAGMHTGDDVEGFYVLKDAFLKTTAAGKPFLSGVLADRSGTIDLKVWDYSGPIGANPADTGRIVKIRGQVSEFKGAPQLTAGRIRMADGNDQYDVSALVPVAPIDPDERLQEIRRLIDSMEDADYQSVARTMLERHLEAFRSIPAAKSVHHSFLSGLLMHTSNMLRLVDYLSGLYAGIIDRSLLLTGTLLHDFAKEREFTFSGLGMVTDYSLSGQLIGHLVMGAQEVQQCAESLGLPQEKSLLLQHMILSHHGEPDFGAAVRPMCAEAELLSLIDLVDSRMEIYAEALQELRAFFEAEAPVDEGFTYGDYTFARADLACVAGAEYCLVGIRAQDGRVDSVCYAVPASPGEVEPPAGLEAYRREGDYWVYCQDISWDDEE